nr:proteinase-activated receptor-2, PAR-2 receptor=G protein-coupled receptor/thrombin receptor homolog [rats, aorta, Peptide Partial, 30 aa] [Rattus sp.]
NSKGRSLIGRLDTPPPITGKGAPVEPGFSV